IGTVRGGCRAGGIVGAFWGAVHFRTTDRQEVIRRAERFVEETKTSLLVGPLLRGWVAVYPQDKGQSAEGARMLIGHGAGVALYLAMHDDDFAVYDLYEDGELHDSYSSSPGYFGRVSAKEKKRLAGNPQKLATAIGASGTAERFAGALRVKGVPEGQRVFHA